jgi:hypothetical protein
MARGRARARSAPQLGRHDRIAITQAAFDAIVGTMPFGEARVAVGNPRYEPRRDPQALLLIWIERGSVEKLWVMLRAGEEIPAADSGGRA